MPTQIMSNSFHIKPERRVLLAVAAFSLAGIRDIQYPTEGEAVIMTN